LELQDPCRAWDSPWRLSIFNAKAENPMHCEALLKSTMETTRLATCIFGKKIPLAFSKISRIWLLLQGMTLWTIWVERNDRIFINSRWEEKKMQESIVQSILEYVRIDWDIARKDVEKATMHNVPIDKYNKVWEKEIWVFGNEITLLPQR